jgi:hypothetical protein
MCARGEGGVSTGAGRWMGFWGAVKGDDGLSDQQRCRLRRSRWG